MDNYQSVYRERLWTGKFIKGSLDGASHVSELEATAMERAARFGKER